MIYIDVDEKVDSGWNDRLSKSELGTIYQTAEWGYVSEYLGWKPIFLRFIDEKGEIIGQLLISVTPRFNKKTTKYNLLRNLPLVENKIYRWSYGPVVFKSEYISDIYKILTDYLQKKKCKVWGMQNPLSPFTDSLEKNFDLQKWSTFVIDLRDSKKNLYDKLTKNSCQKNIERSNNRGVKIVEITESNFHLYYELYNATKKNMGGEPSSDTELLDAWKILKPAGHKGFLAMKDETAVGGLFFSYFNGYIIESGVARSEVDYANKLYSQDLIKWKIIEWGVDNKMNYYDLTGVNPEPQSEKEKGIFRYKEKWGGKKCDYWIIKK